MMLPPETRAVASICTCLWLASYLLVGCGDEPAHGPLEQGRAQVGGDVISTVDGHPITVAHVSKLVRETNLSADEALSRLQGELLLARHAQRRGQADVREVRMQTQRAAVQALLAETEAEIPERSIVDEDVRARFEERRGSLDRPERRRADHLLVVVPEGGDAVGAARVAEAILREWRLDPETPSRYGEGARRDGFAIAFEELPPMARDGSLVEPFETPLFEADELGLLPSIVQTVYGAHAIRVREIVPALPADYDAFAEQLRADLLAERRFAAVAALLERLEQELVVDRDEAAIERAMVAVGTDS